MDRQRGPAGPALHLCIKIEKIGIKYKNSGAFSGEELPLRRKMHVFFIKLNPEKRPEKRCCPPHRL